MTVLDLPLTAPPRAGSLAAALQVTGHLGSLLLLAVADPAERGARDLAADLGAARAALRRESRVQDWVGQHEGQLVVVLAVLPADLDAVADRMLAVVERTTGRTAAAGLCRVDPDRPVAAHLGWARSGLAVAWACGGSRVVRHP